MSEYLCIPTAACPDQDVLHLSASNLARWQCPATITSPHKDDQSESQLVFQWPVRFFTKVRVDTANQGTYAKKEKRENVGIFPKSGTSGYNTGGSGCKKTHKIAFTGEVLHIYGRVD